MSNHHCNFPGIDLFWEQADIEENDDHPLVRELRHRVDAIARYQYMIGEAESMGMDDAVEQLTRQCAREQEVARELRAALRSMR
ncbi:MAG: hypothetical protein ACRELX_12080 [Longimicrobiales bacterium]